MRKLRISAPNIGISILCTIILYFTIQFITFFATFPGEIKLMVNDEKNMSFSSPVSAVIGPDSVEALQINNQPVTDNIKINAGGKMDILPTEPGSGSMTLNLFGVPVKKVTLSVLPEIQVVPCGTAVGVRINTSGVMVLGTGTVDGADGQPYNPSDGILKSGDMIMSANGRPLSTNEDLVDTVRNCAGSVNLSVSRGGQTFEKTLTAVKNKKEGVYSIGVWVRDCTQGIGTLTYYEPGSGHFGALGHGITDVDTKQIMNIRDGVIMSSQINSVNKGRKGAPGNLIGDINNNDVLGAVQKNTPRGIFGVLNYGFRSKLPGASMEIALQDKVHTGPAKIMANVDGKAIDTFDVYIESVNHYSGDDTRGMIIRITDPHLLQRTNGIVQGMSGSPIIQDGRLIGALTHVFLQDPMKGYGIFIENMLNN